MNETGTQARAVGIRVTLSNRQRSHRVNTRLLRKLSRTALESCLERPGSEAPVLPGLGAVEISLVGDRRIAGLHLRFMDVPGPTDVITFDHGEIVISVDTAVRQAREHGQETDRELFRYIVHGLLHLNGHEDATTAGSSAMWNAQEEIVAALRPVSAQDAHLRHACRDSGGASRVRPGRT